MKQGLLAIGAGALGALFWAVPALADAPRSIPIYMSDTGHIMADAYVDGEGPFTFIVDTAAGSTVVFDDFANEAQLEDITGDQRIMVQGASGITEARLVRVGDMRLGTWEFALDQAVALPSISHLDNADGVLGANVLLSQPVGFALGEGELRIYDEGTAIDGAQTLGPEWFAVPIEQRIAHSGLYWTIVEVNGIELDAVIDTGARRSTINPAGALALGIDVETAGLAPDEPIRGATNDETLSWILPVATVQVGDRVWGRRDLTVSDLSVFERFGMADQPALIFGADFLAEQNFIIDPVENVMWMKKRQSAALGYLNRPTTELSSAVR